LYNEKVTGVEEEVQEATQLRLLAKGVTVWYSILKK
jgi:hypothetical protein